MVAASPCFEHTVVPKTQTYLEWFAIGGEKKWLCRRIDAGIPRSHAYPRLRVRPWRAQRPYFLPKKFA